MGTKSETLAVFEQLRKQISIDLESNVFQESGLIQKAGIENPWFTPDSITMAFKGILELLNPTNLSAWLSHYEFSIENTNKTIGVVMAGNIPMVGFHDILCVLSSGNKLKAKLSGKDKVLYTYLKEQILKANPQWENRIEFTEGTLKDIDAIIATGSDNTARYFEYYFGKYPNIIRKNRSSVAILTGNETDEELLQLGYDVFSYFGLGCRNVSHLLIPPGFDMEKLLRAFEAFPDVINHHKYANNYDYQRNLLLMQNRPFYEGSNVLLVEDTSLASPIGVVHYQYYNSQTALNSFVEINSHKIQCIISATKQAFNTYALGMAQYPEVDDYADGVDTMHFLMNLQ